MKKYILLAAATLALAACDNNDNYVDEPVAAQISATIGESAETRASGESWDRNDKIGITMGTKYTNMEYTTNGDGTFTGTTLYFNNKNDLVTITAYYPYTGTEGQTPAVIEATTSVDLQTAYDQPKFDFLYCTQEVKGENPKVNLQFSHRMSKLTIKFEGGNGTDLSKIKIESCRISGLTLNGTFNPVSGECKASTTPSDLNLTPTDNTLTPLIIFPQNGDNVTMKIHDSESQDYTCDLKFPDGIKPGNNYQFTIKVNKTTLSVNTTITDWNTENVESEAKSDDGD